MKAGGIACILFAACGAAVAAVQVYQPPAPARAPLPVDYTATPSLPGRADLRPQMKTLESWRQTEYQRLRASGSATAADFKRVDDQFLARARQAEGLRTDALKQLNQHAGIDIKQGAGGTQPSQGRGLSGDIDTDSLSARDFQKVKNTAEKMGYKVSHHGDSMTIEELNVTVHRQSAAEAKTGSRLGSSAHVAETGRGFNEETALGFKANNPNASVSDNLKKAAHTLETPPSKLGSDDLQKLGKMAGRNYDELKKLDPGKASQFETLKRQSDMLKQGYSPEAAGITDLGKYQRDVRAASVEAVKATERWADTQSTQLTQRAQSAREAYDVARKSGDPARIQEAHKALVEARSNLIGFKETQAAAREAAVLNKANGDAATKVMAEARRLPTEGKPPSVIREQLVANDRISISRTANEPVVPGAKAAAGEAASLGSRMMKGAMGILAIYGAITGIKEGAAKAGEESVTKGDSTLVSILKTAGYGIWHGLGFGAAQQTGQAAGDASAQQWADDVKAGRVDPNSKLSQAWAKLRAVGWGLADFTGLTSIKDAVVEGGGYAKDRYTQYQAEKNQAQQQKDVADKRAAQGEGKDGQQKGLVDPKQVAQPGGEKDKQDKDKDKADKEKADKEKTERDKAEKEKAEKERAEKEKADKERAEKEKAEKERAEREKAEHDRRMHQRERAEYERQAAEKEARERAERERQARERAEAERRAAAAQAAQQAAQQRQVPAGTREEVAGTARTASGSTKLTYIKDAAGNVLGGYYTHYDASGREVGRENFTSKPDSGGAAPSAGKAGFDGSYSGRVSGGASGALNFTVRSGAVSGRISGSYQGDGAFASISGSVDAQGNFRASANGYVRGALGEKGKMENWEFSGALTGRISGRSASGSWSAAGFGKSAGTWSAAR